VQNTHSALYLLGFYPVPPVYILLPKQDTLFLLERTIRLVLYGLFGLLLKSSAQVLKISHVSYLDRL